MEKGLKVLSELSETDKPFQNPLDVDSKPPNLLSVCYFCMGDQTHGDETFFLKNTDSGESKLSSQ